MNKNLGLILIIIILLIQGQIISTPLYFNKKLSNNIIKNLLFDFNTFTFNKMINHRFNINVDSTNILKQMNKKNNVDILMGNHYSTIDFILMFYLLNCVQRKDIIILMKKSLIYYPVLNIHLDNPNYIKLNRNWEDDKDVLEESIKKINNGIIIIFPEGTRLCKDTYNNTKKYCKENNIVLNKNLLIPRVKGLFNIVNTLKKNNKMGNLYDMTSIIPQIMENFHNTEFDLVKLFSTNISNSYHFIRKLNLPDYYFDYDIFKNWLYHQWNTKDFIISNYRNYKYKQLEGRYNNKNIISCYILIIIYIYMIKNYPYQVAGNFAVSYILPIISNFLKK